MPRARGATRTQGPSPGAPADGKAEQVLQATKPNGWMIGVGVLLVVLFVAWIVLARTLGNETTEKTTTLPSPTETSKAATTGTSSGPSTTPTATDKTTKTKNVPSDNLLTGLLAAGAVLILVGFLYGRVTSIKVLGAEIGLVPSETDTTVKKVADKMKGEPAEKVVAAQKKALDQARVEKQSSQVAALSDREIDQIATRAVETVQQLAGPVRE